MTKENQELDELCEKVAELAQSIKRPYYWVNISRGHYIGFIVHLDTF
jgi:hypothetical protein